MQIKSEDIDLLDDFIKIGTRSDGAELFIVSLDSGYGSLVVGFGESSDQYYTFDQILKFAQPDDWKWDSALDKTQAQVFPKGVVT